MAIPVAAHGFARHGLDALDLLRRQRPPVGVVGVNHRAGGVAPLPFLGGQGDGGHSLGPAAEVEASLVPRRFQEGADGAPSQPTACCEFGLAFNA